MLGLHRFWLFFFGIFLSLTWLMPNRAYPWTSFHNDAWAALILSLVALIVCWRMRFRLHLEFVGIVVLAIAAIPLLQYASGLVLLPGTAWINFAYVLGFATAICVGSAWAKQSPGEASSLLFIATALGGLVSVVLQINQVFYLNLFGPWGLPPVGSRPFANMGQPNQLASLQLLAVLAFAWAYTKGILRGSWAVLCIFPLLVGLVLTESRTVWLTFVFITALSFWKRDLLPSKSNLGVIFVIVAVFFFMVSQLNAAYVYLELNPDGIQKRSFESDPRWQLWKEIVQASMLKPLSGFGWGQSGVLNKLILEANISNGGNYLQAHNAFLDFLIWSGWPLGICISGLIIAWYVCIFFKIRTAEQLIQLMFVSVLLIHAMLEYPLQYAYFLLPFGLMVGELSAAHIHWNKHHKPSVLPSFLVGLSFVFLSVIIVDYFKVENRFFGLRFEIKGIPTDIPKIPPNVILLTQWSDYMEYARKDFTRPYSAEELSHFENVVTTVPTVYLMHRFAMTLAFQNKPDEAQKWLHRICKLNAPDQCTAVKDSWKTYALTYPAMRLVEFPE